MIVPGDFPSLGMKSRGVDSLGRVGLFKGLGV